MNFKRLQLLCLLLTCILTVNTGQAQTDASDSVSFSVPPAAESIFQTDEEYNEDEYGSEESYEDSVQRAETNAFDTIDRKAGIVEWREVPGSFIDHLKKDDAFDYVNDGIPQRDMATVNAKGLLLQDIWIYIAITILIILLVWYLIANNLLFFRKKPAAISSGESEKLLKDIFSIDYATAIKDALDHQHYRLAIRLHYLQLLKTLSAKGVIHYQPGKTNFDYLLQVRSTSYYPDFSGLTRQYEYCWYGQFPINRAQYDRLEQLFVKFYQKIGAQ